MFTKTLQDAINEQINKELYSAYLYLSMAAYFEGQNLGGFSNWMKVQYQEETAHAMKFFAYLYRPRRSCNTESNCAAAFKI